MDRLTDIRTEFLLILRPLLGPLPQKEREIEGKKERDGQRRKDGKKQGMEEDKKEIIKAGKRERQQK